MAKHIRRPTSDPTSDAGAYGAALHGQDAAQSKANYAAGEPTYATAESVIAQNQSGGAGYFAEAHHTASLNIDATHKGLDISADRLGSTAFGSPDIVLNNGDKFNPKFYATAEGSYAAGAETVGDGSGVTAKYAGQTIIVPSDQLEQVQTLHASAISAAVADGNLAEVQALRSIDFNDHILHGGVASIPLTYADAQAGAETIRQGDLPGYVGEDATLLGAGSEGALFAASIALAATMGPQLARDAADVLRGNLTFDDATSRLRQSFGDARTRSELGWAAGRGGGAVAATVLGALDPIGAALLVNLAVDVMRLSQDLKNGSIDADQFGPAIAAKLKDRGAYIALTAGSVWIAGPLGLLVPIIVRRSVEDKALQREAMRAWHGAADAMHAELQSRVKGAALLDTVRKHYESADVSAEGSQRATKAIANDLNGIRRLLGYTPGPSAPKNP